MTNTSEKLIETIHDSSCFHNMDIHWELTDADLNFVWLKIIHLKAEKYIWKDGGLSAGEMTANNDFPYESLYTFIATLIFPLHMLL